MKQFCKNFYLFFAETSEQKYNYLKKTLELKMVIVKDMIRLYYNEVGQDLLQQSGFQKASPIVLPHSLRTIFRFSPEVFIFET